MALGIPVIVKPSGGLPVKPVTNLGVPAVLVTANGIAVTVSARGIPMIIAGYVP